MQQETTQHATDVPSLGTGRKPGGHHGKVRATLSEIYPFVGVIGTVAVVLGVVITASRFADFSGEQYSPLVRMISELGEPGRSRLALIFNVSLVLTGIAFVLFAIGLAIDIPSRWSIPAVVAGVVTGVGCAAVGLAPMNHLQAHLAAANTFFYGGLIAMLLYSLALAAGRSRPSGPPRWTSIVGLVGAAVFAAFLFLPKLTGWNFLGATREVEVGRSTLLVAPLAVLEWLVFVAVIGWAFTISVIVLVRRARTRV